jgi:hypothetical protein
MRKPKNTKIETGQQGETSMRDAKKQPDLEIVQTETAPVTEETKKPEPKKLAPVTVGNPAAASSMAIDQASMEEFASTEEGPSTVVCQRPGRGVFFTVRPETTQPWRDRAFYFLLQMEGRDPLIVAPEIAKLKSDEDTIRPILLVRYVTMAGEEGLWPVKLDPPDGKSNRWNRSALNILELAASGKWVRIISAKGEYRYTVSKRTFERTPPRFSDRLFKELVDEAFKDRSVSSLDHEIWNILEDGSDK